MYKRQAQTLVHFRDSRVAHALILPFHDGHVAAGQVGGHATVRQQYSRLQLDARAAALAQGGKKRVPGFTFHRTGPVSYTHLDVYKRQ